MYFHFRMWSWVLQFKQTGFAAVAEYGRNFFCSSVEGSTSTRIDHRSLEAAFVLVTSVQFFSWNRPP